MLSASPRLSPNERTRSTIHDERSPGCDSVASCATLLDMESAEQENRAIVDIPSVTTPSRKRSRPSLEAFGSDIVVGDDSIGFWKVEPTMAAASSVAHTSLAFAPSPSPQKQRNSPATGASLAKPKRRRSITQDERPPSRRNSFGPPSPPPSPSHDDDDSERPEDMIGDAVNVVAGPC